MLRAGIVGLPNVGKSTLFNALTRTRKAESANYPFCTIEPNVGIVSVPDDRLAPIAKVAGTPTLVPAAVELVDIAGLVKGAASGEGLGNKFLSHIRQVDAIVQVVRCFEDSNIVHVEAHLHPIADIETIQTELMLADMESLARQKERLERVAGGGDKVAKAQIEVATRLLEHLEAGKPALTLEMTADEREIAQPFFLLSMKPTLYACNVAESDLAGALAGTDSNPLVAEVRKWVATHHGAEAVTVSAQIESELSELPEAEAKEYLSSLGVAESGVGALIRSIYHLLGLRTYFTAGEKEARAWTIHNGDTAPQAAAVIHTDLARGFIKAETIRWEEFVRVGGWARAREGGHVRQEGKEYPVADGDVILFKFNV
ncbi:MAG: redox-regulated ATPase YchF [Thermoanaerobaculia bacterium]